MGNSPLISILQRPDDRILIRCKAHEMSSDDGEELFIITSSKAFLVHISPVFNAALTTGFKETSEGIIDVENFSHEDMNAFLHYAAAYSFPVGNEILENESISVPDNVILKLLPVAAYYQSSIVSESLIKRINAKPTLEMCSKAEFVIGGCMIAWESHVISALAKELWAGTQKIFKCLQCDGLYEAPVVCSGKRG